MVIAHADLVEGQTKVDYGMLRHSYMVLALGKGTSQALVELLLTGWAVVCGLGAQHGVVLGAGCQPCRDAAQLP